MSRRKRKGERPRYLVSEYMEQVSSDLFSKFPKELPALVRGRHGVYALYKEQELYYVGLARDLGKRLSQHMRDHHKEMWSRFSLYLFSSTDHLREVEALILRIATPEGNASPGHLVHAHDLAAELEARVEAAQEKQRRQLFALRRRRAKRCTRNGAARAGRANGRIPLAPFVHKRFYIRKIYKGQLFRACVCKDGRIRLNGAIYNTPSQAARAVTGYPTTGWTFWEMQAQDDTWVKLDALRRGQ